MIKNKIKVWKQKCLLDVSVMCNYVFPTILSSRNNLFHTGGFYFLLASMSFQLLSFFFLFLFFFSFILRFLFLVSMVELGYTSYVIFFV